MSCSRASSFSCTIKMPVACGAKACIMPFFTPDIDAASWAWSVRSINWISPRVENLIVLFTTLKSDMAIP